MGRKISFLAALVCGQALMGEASADASSQTLVHKPVQFYAGLSGGVERMSGRRSESVNEGDLAGGRATTVYTDRHRMLENNATVSAIAGFLWKLPPLPVWMGPEVYWGRGNTLSSIKDTRLDFVPDNRFYATDFQRKFFYGALVRLGYQFCVNYLTYVSVGLDRSQFSTTRVLTNDPANLTTTRVQRTKGFNGVLLGLGLEKQIDRFIVGLDLRMIQYRRQSSEDAILTTPVAGPGTMSLSVRPIMYSAALRFCYRF